MADGTTEAAERSFSLDSMACESTYMQTLFELNRLRHEGCIHAIVVSYDRSRHVAEVRPLLNHKKQTRNGLVAYRRESVTVPVLAFRHGGFSVDAPLFVGDTGYLIAADRNGTVGAIGRNSAALTDPQKPEEQEGSLEDVKESERLKIIEGSRECDRNEGPQNCDDARICAYANGFFLPCSWARSELEGDAAATSADLLVSFSPPEDDGKCRPFSLKVGGKGIELVRDGDGDMRVSIRVDDDGIEVVRGKDGSDLCDRLLLGPSGLKYEGKPDRRQTVVTDVRYDVGSHQFQKRTVTQKIRGDFVVGVSEETGWTMIDGGQSVPETV